jgi:hypothetical protein
VGIVMVNKWKTLEGYNIDVPNSTCYFRIYLKHDLIMKRKYVSLTFGGKNCIFIPSEVLFDVIEKLKKIELLLNEKDKKPFKNKASPTRGTFPLPQGTYHRDLVERMSDLEDQNPNWE